ncbi:MAG: STAS domain-containing protein [Nocardioidaceae bacterium]|nr:STAS domain-containing protein [Nocardioidaceae bacterium]
MQLDIRRDVQGSTLVLSGRGEIDLGTLDVLDEELAKAVQDDAQAVVVDLTGVGFIDSTGLGVLVNAHKRLVAAGKALTLRIVAPSEMLKLFTLTGLDQLFTIEQVAKGGDAAPSAS